MNKQNKTKQLLKFMNVLSLPVGMWNSESCQFYTAHASFILIMLFLALQRVILEKCQNINFWKLVGAGLHAILTYRPVTTGFQVDLEIYKDKVNQSGNRILSSHITK